VRIAIDARRRTRNRASIAMDARRSRKSCASIRALLAANALHNTSMDIFTQRMLGFLGFASSPVAEVVREIDRHVRYKSGKSPESPESASDKKVKGGSLFHRVEQHQNDALEPRYAVALCGFEERLRHGLQLVIRHLHKLSIQYDLQRLDVTKVNREPKRRVPTK